MTDSEKNSKASSGHDKSGSHSHGHHHHHHHHHDPTVDSNENLDPASKALAEALRLSFVVLKLVMICVIAFFIYRGFYWVEQNEVALELRFGSVKGGESVSAVLQPGPHWAWPYPVEEVVIIPGELAERELSIDDFWYFDPQATEEAMGLRSSRVPQTLRFGTDGYSLTASRSAAVLDGQEDANDIPITDYNIIHYKWRIRYRVTNPQRFFSEIWSGAKNANNRYDWTGVENYLRALLADAVIVTSANWDIEQMWGRERGQGAGAFSNAVEQEFTSRLEASDIGLTVQLNLLDWRPPRQVQDAFDAAARASSQADEWVQGAQAQASEVRSTARAEAEIIIAQAEAYRTRVVEAAAADANYIDIVLDRIDLAVSDFAPDSAEDYAGQRAQLLAVTIDELYQEALRDVLASADEAFVLNAAGDAAVELRPVLSRDATLAPRQTENDTEQEYVHTPVNPMAPGPPR
ncbi:MAG: hypothetical protein JW936_06470 [Sedimentisphaerales bacterium]|nr:hypothetical protein [Sedimentisphaerales bacterium]